MEEEQIEPSLRARFIYKVFGKPRDIHDSSLFHKLSLIPILAWIGLGADGLSSSAYGPEEAFRALGNHTYLAVFLALATALTVFIISYAYSRIIEHFPHGGGGYIVATHTLGERVGVISGCALLVDYILTITVSIASCGDAIFSFLPFHFHIYKIPFDMTLIMALIVMNIRGVKESVSTLAPIFLIFILSHLLLIGYGIFSYMPEIGPLISEIKINFNNGLTTLGGLGMAGLFLHSYSLGGGTYTGIEAVSNGIQIMREPGVQTGKRTMVYMATSLAITAGGLLICYLLLKVRPSQNMTLNAIIAETLFGRWPFGHTLAVITIFSEGALLFVAAQTGFIDGPRVMANMAIDSWLPHRFSSLSERLTMRNGVLLMGVSSIALLLYTKGNISALIVMYSINVFLTFSLSELGMSRFFIKNRNREKQWKKHLPIHMIGLSLCTTILVITATQKFKEGGWLTLVITMMVICACHLIHGHYLKVRTYLAKLDDGLKNIPPSGNYNDMPVDPKNNTAIQLVSSYNGFGIHTFLSVLRNFPGLYKNFLFVSIAVVDSGSFKGAQELKNLESACEDSLKKYVELARKAGIPADYRMTVGTEVVSAATEMCKTIHRKFPQSTVFTGQLTFQLEKFYHRFLHNETAYAIQRHLQWNGITSVILPIRIEV